MYLFSFSVECLEREGLPASFKGYIVSALMSALPLYLCYAVGWITAEAGCMDYSLPLFVLMNLEGEKLKVLYPRYIIF